ncbi:carboxylesterase/lipase family protein [Nonomuraea sediminis]|uniref:carboxylesterase/lipase family protein n=1 Tax=Nonomuraea sediminis TaxID=2835864 RepID=UPI001BDC9E8C|nr:carboxylesterase family protein [Nonomuraea sediminis]
MDAEVRVGAGVLRGEWTDEIAVFRGVPYAEAPFGRRRFRPAEAVAPWTGVRDAVAFGPGCPQPLPPPTSFGRLTSATSIGEDCLNLNVWTPDPGAAGLPVMVWIHGGGYLTGSGSARAHHGDTFARDGVVYVSINYRLNVDGFLYLPGGHANLGLQDQVAALRWVHDNIKAFGGDPDNVTIFGQSGGGVSVMNLLAIPSARGLFRRAIAQSGTPAAAVDPDRALTVTHRMAELVGIDPTPDAFAAVPLGRLIQAVMAMQLDFLDLDRWRHETFLVSPFRSVVDGDVLPADILSAVSTGSSAGIDVLAGTTRDETSSFLRDLDLLGRLDDRFYTAALNAFALTNGDLDAYRKESRPDAGLAELVQAAWTDWAFRVPTIRLLEAHAVHGGRAHAYEFTWPSPTSAVLGATHCLEMPFVTDSLSAWTAALTGEDNLWGDAPPRQLADRMHQAWLDFAATGDPGWPAYDTATRATMRFDATSEVVDDLAGTERELWDGRR